jgi:hypothetical protein
MLPARKTGLGILLLGLLLGLGPGGVAGLAQNASDYRRVEDVIYGRKHGVALTLDVFQPARTNGYGILFMVSGGFFSSKSAINPAHYRPFLQRGYTVFAAQCRPMGDSARQVGRVRRQRRRASLFDAGHTGASRKGGRC